MLNKSYRLVARYRSIQLLARCSTLFLNRTITEFILYSVNQFVVNSSDLIIINIYLIFILSYLIGPYFSIARGTIFKYSMYTTADCLSRRLD